MYAPAYILNAKSLVALFISLQDLGRKNKYTNSYMNLTVILLNCQFCFSHQRKCGKCKKHVHDVYLVKNKSLCILVCSFVIDSVQLTDKR